MGVLDLFKLEGKTAIITGAGQGIGRGIATGLAEAGANVVLAGVNVKTPERSEPELRELADELSALGVRALPVVTEMRNEADVAALVERAAGEFGGVDVMVNNVGGGTIPTPLLKLSPEHWRENVRENVNTTFLGCRIAGAHMAERGSGTIVNLAAIAGIGPSPYYAHYAAAKAGVISITRTFAAELAPAVRVNAIIPYLIRTGTVNAAMQADPALEAEALSMTPLGRLGTPVEVASLALFLASDASSYITGQSVRLTGGAQPGSNLSVTDPK